MSGSSAQLWHCIQRLALSLEQMLSEGFEVKLGLHQGSVLSPLLFAAVMDVASSEARSGLPSDLLYADDLVIMAPAMDQLGRRVANWRASLLDKGLKVNASKSNVILGSSGGKMMVNSGKWPCGVCGFRCIRCDGTNQEGDIAEDQLVDGETYECVNSVCYLGDIVDGDGGTDLVASATIRNG